jgi:hypothetical protein
MNAGQLHVLNRAVAQATTPLRADIKALSQRVEELSAQNLRLTQRLNYQEAKTEK